jgi:AcrR family transcriptional regulator
VGVQPEAHRVIVPRPASVPRRSQAARSAETRTRLLDATIDCLLRYGYAGTTTPRVAELAGVTRGAQVHHFGSRDHLMLAALQHLADKRIASAVPRFGDGVTKAADPLGAMLDIAWEIHRGPIFIPVVELWVAGRTDRALAREVARFESVAVGALIGAIQEFLPAEICKPMLEFMYAAMDTLRGILISAFVDSDPTRAARRWERAKTNLRLLADPAINDWIAARPLAE